eukprot:5027089-Amphidinium_carterae.4
MKDLNQSVQHLQASVSDVHIQYDILGIDLAVAGCIVYSDASLANACEQRTQVSMDFASHKLRRVLSSTLMAESAALVEALCAVELLVAWRRHSTSPLYHRSTSKMGTIELKVNERGVTSPRDEVLAVVDNKSLYDVLFGENLDGVDKHSGLATP